MRIVALALVCLMTISLVSSHAVLTNPVSWNTNPSKTSPCGGGTPATAPVATYCKGQPATLTWKVVAGDGTGPLTISIDPAGGTSFTTVVNQVAPAVNPNAVSTFKAVVTMPDITCDKCTLQVFSSSNWFSCSTIKIAEKCDTPVEDRQAVLADDLTFCGKWVNEHVVSIPVGQTAETIDDSVAATFAANLKNPLVFQNNDTNCANKYAAFLCAYNFPLDDPSGNVSQPIYKISEGQCAGMNDACATTDLHRTLYPCDSYPTSNNAFNIVPSMIAFVAVVVLALLF
ncbi:putative transmembrane protein [Heterostelium album PN500]|uniref:Putative transmembrane protein n=1 Tax=Heterostelium pallidum (strain ATCC 26659 / Pp 5 / PN500) TaxID=670386 RepID=D3BGP8_HETP5|nr:putative transmembrane protein [Heterostelium album PN500]EFA79282.1 putative transmembrane protein [Heterostelium album PN500]|eukprot:XP_020431403.1 putative transmembrane protein [Heterostelium album PN500]